MKEDELPTEEETIDLIPFNATSDEKRFCCSNHYANSCAIRLNLEVNMTKINVCVSWCHAMWLTKI